MLQGKDPRCGQPLHVQRCRGVVVLWGHNYIDHYCNVGHNYVGHNYIYHKYVGHNCIDHTYTGYNHMFMARASGTSTRPCACQCTLSFLHLCISYGPLPTSASMSRAQADACTFSDVEAWACSGTTVTRTSFGAYARALALKCSEQQAGHNYIGHNYVGHNYMGHNNIVCRP